eukprot:scaffold4568_cov141-Pinguiococcus_pyrenoidosus.AAC.1
MNSAYINVGDSFENLRDPTKSSPVMWAVVGIVMSTLLIFGYRADRLDKQDANEEGGFYDRREARRELEEWMAQQGFPDTLQQKLTHAGVYSMKEIILLEELSPFEFDKVAFRFEFTSEDRTVVSKALKAHKAAMIFESPSGKAMKFWSKGASKRTPGAIKNSVIANSPSSMSSELSAENFGRALENSYDAFYED